MKPKSTLRHFLALAGSSLLAISSASAQWLGANSGDSYAAGNGYDYDATGNWSGGVVNDNFSTLGLTGPLTISLDAARTTTGLLNLTLTGANDFSLLSDGATSRAITLGGNVTADVTDGNQTITIGTSARPVTLNLNNGTRAFTVGTGDTLIVNGVISSTTAGSGLLTKSGSGTLTLAAANTYTGLTTVSAGELRWGIANALSSGNLTINSTGTVNMQTFADTVGTVTLNAGGTIQGSTGVLTTGTGGLVTTGGTISFVDATTPGAVSLGGTTTAFTYNTASGSETTASINRLYTGGGTTAKTFTIADGVQAVDVDITEYFGHSASANTPIIKAGSGVLQLSGSDASTNLGTGALNINDGVLLLNKSASVNAFGGTGTITIGDGTNGAGTAVLRHATGSANNQILNNSIVINNTDGLWDLNGHTETTTGTLSIQRGGQLDLNGGNLTIGNTTYAVSSGSANTTPIKNTAGSGALTLGTLGITPIAGFDTTFSLNGATMTLGGTLTFTAATTGRAQITGGTVALGANRTFTVGLGTGSTYDLDIDGPITGPAFTLTHGSTGRLQFSGNTSNSYSGLTTVNGAGTLLLNKTDSAQAIANAGLTLGGANNSISRVTYTGGSSDMMGNGILTINGRSRFDFNGHTDTIGNVAIVNTGASSDANSILNTAGGGNLTIGTLGITPVAGLTTVINAGASGGTITLGGDVTFTAATTGQAQITGQTLALGAASRTFTIGAGTGANQDLLISAGISGSGVGLTKSGGGRLALTGTNGYTGATTVNAGTLLVNGSGSLHANSAVTINSGGTLAGSGIVNGTVAINGGGTLAGNGTFNETVTASGGAILSPAGAGAIGTLTLANNTASALTLNSSSYSVDVDSAGTSADQVAITGNLVLNGANMVLLNLPAAGVAATGSPLTLMTYNATTGPGSLVFANGLTTMGNATLAVNAGNVQLSVAAGGLNNCIWSGATGAWDGGATNWTRNGTTSQAFQNGDFVTFDDTGTTTTVTSSGTVSPSLVTVNNSTKAYTINASIGGSGALIKSGSNTLTLGGTNSFSGGTVINGGTVTMSALDATNLGGTGANITFNGAGTLTGGYGGAYSFGSLAVNGTATLSAGSGGGNYMTFNGPVTGSGTLRFQSASNGYATAINLNSTANTFTGPIIYLGNANNGNDTINVNSIADAVGAGSIQVGANNRPAQYFNYGSGAIAPLTLNYRQIVLGGTTGGSVVKNNNTTQAITINTDLGIGAVGNKTLTLEAVAGPDNTWAGKIQDGSGSVISLTKSGAGKWILTGANTYSGSTTIQDGALEIRGAGQLGAGGTYVGNISNTDTTPSPFTFDSTANTTISGVISGSMALIKDGAGTLSLTNANTYTGNTSVDEGTLSLGNGTTNSNLHDFSTFSVASGAVVNLNYAGSDFVFYLNLDGSPAAAGTWGATGSGATHIDDTHFTGTGVIYNLAGDSTVAGIAFWDGGSVNIGTDGNAASAGGAGTWNTTTQNWDVGFTAHAPWLNTASSKAIFAGAENADRTVTLAEAVNIKELSFETTGTTGTRYKIDGGTLNFGAGGVIRSSNNQHNQTITSTITGSPAVEIKDFGGNTYLGLVFAPTTGKTQTLGAALNPNNTGNQDKAGLTLAGSTTGNSVASINYAGGDQYADTNLQSGEWSIPGGIRTGTLRVSGGTHTIGGFVRCNYNGFLVTGSGKVKGAFTIAPDVSDTIASFATGTTISPGNSIGTVTFTALTSNKLQLQTGSSYEWEVGAANATDTINITKGTLEVLTGVTLKVVNAGGAPAVGDQLPVFTYSPGVTTPNTATLQANVTIDLSGTTYTGTPSIVNDTVNGVIYVTGISGGATYTVTYDGNGGTGSVPVDGNTYATGATVTVLGSGSLVKSGYVFTGWNTLATGLGTHYNPSATFTMGSSNVTLYADWKTSYQVWADSYLPADVSNPAGNNDGDSFNNLQEFAFAFNPTVSDGGGTLTISGGAITQNGPPQIYVDPVTGQFFLRYTRRTDHATAGITYTAQFAPNDLAAFEGVTGGSVVATGTGAGGVAIEAVSIEFPDALPISGRKARFGRVQVVQTP